MPGNIRLDNSVSKWWAGLWNIKCELLNWLVLAGSLVQHHLLRLPTLLTPIHLQQFLGTLLQLQWPCVPAAPQWTAGNIGSLALFKEIITGLPLQKTIFSLSAAPEKCAQRTNMISSLSRSAKGFMHHLRLKTEHDAHTLCNLHNGRNDTLRVATSLLKTARRKKTNQQPTTKLACTGITWFSATARVFHQHLNR